MMRIRIQNKLTCILWGIAILMSIITLTEGVYGVDKVEQYYQKQLAQQSRVHEQETKDLSNKLRQREEENQTLTSEVVVLNEMLKNVNETKESLEQKNAEAQRQIGEVKAATGGDDDTPLATRVRSMSDSFTTLQAERELAKGTFNELSQALQDVPGNNLPDKVVFLINQRENLEQKNAEAQRQIGEVKAATGGNEGDDDTPLATRVRSLSDSLTTLQAERELAMGTFNKLNQVLQDVRGNNLPDKVMFLINQRESLEQKNAEAQRQIGEVKAATGGNEGDDDTPLATRVRSMSDSFTTLQAERELAMGTFNKLNQVLQDVRGNNLLDKVMFLINQRENTEKALSDKEDAYKDLYLRLANTTASEKLLAEELSNLKLHYWKQKQGFIPVWKKNSFNSKSPPPSNSTLAEAKRERDLTT